MKTILIPLILCLSFITAQAQMMKVTGNLISDVEFESKIYNQTRDGYGNTTYEWADWPIFSYYRDFSIKLVEADTLQMMFIRWANSPCADTTRVDVIYSGKGKIDTDIVLNGSRYIIE